MIDVKVYLESGVYSVFNNGNLSSQHDTSADMLEAVSVLVGSTVTDATKYLVSNTSGLNIQQNRISQAGALSMHYNALFTQVAVAPVLGRANVNTLGSTTITPAKTSTGIFTFTASTAIFTAGGKTVASIRNAVNGTAELTYTSTTVLTVTTRDYAGAVADGVLTASELDIKIYE